MGQKYPKPKDINFPEAKKVNWKILSPGKKPEDQNVRVTSITLLKSGNILISYYRSTRKDFNLRSFLIILTVPKLEVVQKYEFEGVVVDDICYVSKMAHQLKNGNIFAFCDKLYIFDGEDIAKGPKKDAKICETLIYSQDEKFFEPSDKREKYPIHKTFKYLFCDFILEIKDGEFIFTDRYKSENHYIFYFKIKSTIIEKERIFIYTKKVKNTNEVYKLDIIHRSEHYPEMLYIVGNLYLVAENGYESIFLGLNVNKLLKNGEETKPAFKIDVSKTQHIIGLCEYDKKYVLLDSFKEGIIIIDMDTKQPVAVSIPKYIIKELKGHTHGEYFKTGQGPLYRKIIKLKNGNILAHGKIIDIREEKILLEFKTDILFVEVEDYIVYPSMTFEVLVVKLIEE